MFNVFPHNEVPGISFSLEMEKKVELLQNDKVLLARAVKSQHERIQVSRLAPSLHH